MNVNKNATIVGKFFNLDKFSFTKDELRDYAFEMTMQAIMSNKDTVNVLSITADCIDKFAKTNEEVMYITLVISESIHKSFKLMKSLVEMSNNFEEMYKSQNN